MKQVYVIVSKTGTLASRLIKIFTHDKYNHASISLRPNLKTIYSFGRKYVNNPVYGGFVKESPDYGTFTKFPHSKIEVIAFDVTDETYYSLEGYLENMYEHKKDYKYNYIGLFTGMLNKNYKRDNYFYCSEFVAYILDKFNIVEKGFSNRFVKPMDFLNIKNGRVVYKGEICDFKTPLPVTKTLVQPQNYFSREYFNYVILKTQEILKKPAKVKLIYVILIICATVFLDLII